MNSRINSFINVITINQLLFSAFELFSYEKFSLGSISGIFIALKLYFGWIWSMIVGVWDVGTDTVSFMGNAIKNYF